MVVVPALNEQETIGQVVKDVKNFGFSVLVIDDGSSDQTSQRARAAGASVLELSMNLGVGGALQSGFNFALRHKYEAVVQIDADGQHPADEINNLVDKANATGSDLVLGSRFLSDSPSMQVSVTRRVAMLLLKTVASKACRTQISDSSSGFRLIRNPLLKHFAKSFPSHYLGDTFEALVISGRRKYKIVEIPASIADR
ncbi:MAG: glycosyltransferase family 2 protein, partial [Acidimicrobiia bacterium]|nr:glycosyltransferase family 2 protein [Acidimicrobiia bacterium]